MGTIRSKLYRLSATATAETRARTRAKARDHEMVFDEPVSLHGDDQAANPLEGMLSAYLGCANVMAHTIADERGLTINAMTLSVTGHLDLRVAMGKPGADAPFPGIDLEVDVDTDASDAEIEALKEAVSDRCPVSVILRRSGAEMNEVWRRM